MALHLVHEAAFCVNALRHQRSLTQKGFELSNGLPFVPTDFAIHQMLGSHTMTEAQVLQVALGKIRRASGHFQGRLLGIDPIALKVAPNARRAGIVSAPRKRRSKWRSVSSAWTWTVPSHSVLSWPLRLEQ